MCIYHSSAGRAPGAAAGRPCSKASGNLGSIDYDY